MLAFTRKTARAERIGEEPKPPQPLKMSVWRGTLADVKKHVWTRMASLANQAAREGDENLLGKLVPYKNAITTATNRDELGQLLREINELGKRESLAGVVNAAKSISHCELKTRCPHALGLLEDLSIQSQTTRDPKKLAEIVARAEAIAAKDRALNRRGVFHFFKIW